MLLLEIRNVPEGSKVGARAPSRVMSPSNSCKMRNNQSVVKLVSLYDLVITVTGTCSVCVRMCVCVCVSVHVFGLTLATKNCISLAK